MNTRENYSPHYKKFDSQKSFVLVKKLVYSYDNKRTDEQFNTNPCEYHKCVLANGDS